MSTIPFLTKRVEELRGEVLHLREDLRRTTELYTEVQRSTLQILERIFAVLQQQVPDEVRALEEKAHQWLNEQYDDDEK